MGHRICYCNYPSREPCQHELARYNNNVVHAAHHPLVALILDHEDGKLPEEVPA